MSDISLKASTEPCAYSKQRLKMKLEVITNSCLEEILQIYDENFLMLDPPKQMMKDRIYEICCNNSTAASHIGNVCNIPKCSYKFICVIDFEATCIPEREFFPNEIIEFPAKLINTCTLEIIDSFHSYCKPSLFPQLSDFCRNLTGIQQSDIDEAKDFPSVLSDFEQWVGQYNESFIILTDGPCDIKHFLVTQCLINKIEFPSYAQKWIDIKTVYQKSYHLKRAKLNEMLSSLSMNFLGKLHCGQDDAENIARLAVEMLKDGCRFRAKATIKKSDFTSVERKLRAFQPERQLVWEKRKHKYSLATNKEQRSNVEEGISAGIFNLDVEDDLDSERILTNYKKHSFASRH